MQARSKLNKSGPPSWTEYFRIRQTAFLSNINHVQYSLSVRPSIIQGQILSLILHRPGANNSCNNHSRITASAFCFRFRCSQAFLLLGTANTCPSCGGVVRIDVHDRGPATKMKDHKLKMFPSNLGTISGLHSCKEDLEPGKVITKAICATSRLIHSLQIV